MHLTEGPFVQHRHRVTRWKGMPAVSQCPFTHKTELTVAQMAVEKTGNHTGKRPAWNGPQGIYGRSLRFREMKRIVCGHTANG